MIQSLHLLFAYVCTVPATALKPRRSVQWNQLHPVNVGDDSWQSIKGEPGEEQMSFISIHFI